MHLSSPTPRLTFGIFRLEDVCVRVQEGMEDFLRTAALEITAEVEATFRWLRKRGVRIGLLSNFDRETTHMLLSRLQWNVGSGKDIEAVLVQQHTHSDPIQALLDQAGVDDSRQAFALVDTPRLLQLGNHNRLGLNLGVLNGNCGYSALAVAPHQALLDEPVQLANYLVSHSLLLPTSPVPAAAPDRMLENSLRAFAQGGFVW